MNGREFFKKYEKALRLLENTYKYIPNKIRCSFTNYIPNKNIRYLLRYLNLRVDANEISDNIYIADNIILKNVKNLNIGRNFSLHEFSYIDAIGGITIGDNVSIAHNSSLISFEHTWQEQDIPIKYNPTKNQSISIGNDVWIGCGVRVLSGTIIEDRVVIAAGSVVKGHLESGHLYGGVPVRKLKKL